MLIGFICVCAFAENPDLFKTVRKRDTAQRYCGKNLVNILRFLCRGQYNGIEEESKRNEEPSQRKTTRGTVYATSPNTKRGVLSYASKNCILEKMGRRIFGSLRRNMGARGSVVVKALCY
jgi:hypothetical protein